MKIDELVLSIVLDAAGLKKGQAATEAALVAIRAESEKTDASMLAGAKKTADAQKKQGDAIAKNSKATEQADKKTQDGARNNAHNYGKWLASIISIGAAMVALNKFKNFAIDLTNSDAAAGRMAENIGMATQDLTAFGNTADKLGGSADAMTADLFKMSQAIIGMPSGGDLPDWLTDPKGFFKLGGDMLPKLLDQSVSMVEKAKMIQERIQSVPAPVAQYAAGKLGLSVGTITAFHDVDWSKLLELQYKLNAANDNDSKLAQKRERAWKSVQDRFESLGRIIVTQISPAFLKLANELVTFLSKKETVTAITTAFKDLATWLSSIDFKAVGQGISQFASDASSIATSLGGWVKMTEALFGLWLGVKFAQVLANLSAFGAATAATSAVQGAGAAVGAVTGSAAAATATVAVIAALIPLAITGLLAYGIGSVISALLSEETNDAIGGTINNVLKRVGLGYNEDAGGKTDIAKQVPHFAKGGIATGPKSGYLAMLHGTETIIPNAGQRAMAQSGGVVNNYYSTSTSDAKITVRNGQEAVSVARQLNASKFNTANGLQ